MKFDYVIIGSGPAGSVLAWKLAKLNFDIAIIDRSNSQKKIINDFFCLMLTIRQVTIRRFLAIN